VPEYFLKDDITYARGTGTDFTRYDHNLGTWGFSSVMLGSEIRYTGEWYRSSEEEVVELIEKYADEHPSTTHVGRMRDPSNRRSDVPVFIRRRRDWRTPPQAEQIGPNSEADSD